LNCHHLVIPRPAAVFSAVGIAMSDVKRVALQSDPMRAPFELNAWSQRFAELRRQLDRQFREERLPIDRLAAQCFVDLQFRGQVHALRVPIEEADLEADDGGKRVIARFIELYEARYGAGTAYPAAGVEAVTFVVEGVAPLPVPAIQPLPRDGSDVQAALRGRRDVYLHQTDGASAVPVYDAGKLQPGHEFDGPALVEDEDTTVLVRSGQRLWVDDFGNLRIVTQ
jgi:N-methylhydantoinase A